MRLLPPVVFTLATTVLTLAQADGAVGPFPSRAALAQARRAVESALGMHPWDGPGARTAGPAGAGIPASAEAVRLALSGRVDLVALRAARPSEPRAGRAAAQPVAAPGPAGGRRRAPADRP